MTFRVEYAENVLRKMSIFLKRKGVKRNIDSIYWESNIHVSSFWHYSITYQFNKNGEKITITHKKRDNHEVVFTNGVITKHTGIRRFDMLFAALDKDFISVLNHEKTYEITQKKVNERFLLKSLYFWSKMEYYMDKKEAQALLFEMFGDEKYQRRMKRIDKAIASYKKDKEAFLKETKTLLTESLDTI